MIRSIAIALIALFAFATLGLAQDPAKQLVGTWKILSLTTNVEGEAPRYVLGTEPKGYIIMTAEGRVMTVLTSGHRSKATNDQERAALLSSLIAYTGTYAVEGDKWVATVEASWNEVYSGENQKQTRYFKLEGDKLYIRTPLQPSGIVPGKMAQSELVFQRSQ